MHLNAYLMMACGMVNTVFETSKTVLSFRIERG
jgi:hypothetical protein